MLFFLGIHRCVAFFCQLHISRLFFAMPHCTLDRLDRHKITTGLLASAALFFWKIDSSNLQFATKDLPRIFFLSKWKKGFKYEISDP